MTIFACKPRRVWRSLLYRISQAHLRLVREERIRELERTLPEPWPRDLPTELLETLLYARSILPQRPTVLIDVGAFRGVFSRAFAAVFPTCRIVCFEPNPSLVGCLSTQLASREALVITKAVSDAAADRAQFFLHRAPSMSSLLPSNYECLRTTFSGDAPEGMERINVPVVTLDDCQELQRFLRSDDVLFIKSDTQGNDLAVLRGAVGTLRRTAGILVEYMFCTPYIGQARFEKLVGYLAEHGFTCRGPQHIYRRVNCEVSGVDFLFTR